MPISPQRVSNIQQGTSNLNITINGALNEIVRFSFSINYKYQDVQCEFINGKTQLTIQLTVSPLVQLNCS